MIGAICFGVQESACFRAAWHSLWVGEMTKNDTDTPYDFSGSSVPLLRRMIANSPLSSRSF